MDIVTVVGIVITIATGIPVVLQLRRHPPGLVTLFFAEMWERFSYYGMRALFVLYLTEHFLFEDKFAQGQYASYTTLVYLMPLIGGFLADRFLGSRKAVVFGAILLVFGQLGMAVQGKPAVQTLSYAGQTYVFQDQGRMNDRKVCLRVGSGCYGVGASADGGMRIDGLPAAALLPNVLPKGAYTLKVADRDPFYVNIMYLALALIIMGVGYLKANISSIVGQLYPQGDPRRDPGFTLYYYGINLGAFWSAVICGAVGQSVGWWAGFGLAGVGMLLGLVVFVLGRPRLEGKGEPPQPERLKRRLVGPVNAEWGLYLASLVGVLVVFAVVREYAWMGWLLGAGALLTFGYLFWYMATKCTPVQRDRLILALVLLGGCVVFFALFEQAGSSLSLFAERNTQLPNSGFMTVTAAQTQSFNPGFILLFAPVFAAAWTALGRRGRDLDPVAKFGLGLVQVGLGFFVLVWASQFHDAAFRVPLLFLGLAYLLHTTGELCLSPVGLSEMTKLAPAALISTLMAIWFLATSGGQYAAGIIARLTSSETVGGQVLDPAAALHTYVTTFRNIGLGGIGFGVLLLVLSPWLKRLAHGVNDASNHPAPEPIAPVFDGDRQAVNPQVIRADRDAE